jgi:predicted PurR-regulated permease PerM
LITIIATVIGGALLGVIGALVAIPIAAAVGLLIEQVAEPSLEKS